MDQNMSELQKVIKEFPLLFDKVLANCKDAPLSNDWVFERMMELFCRDIVTKKDAELIKASNFGPFLKNFFQEDGKLIQYPDFVMNNVSLMASEVLVSGLSLSDTGVDAETALKIIRNPIDLGMVSKGHRIAVSFDCLKRCLAEEDLCKVLNKANFDASSALSNVVASPQNYASKSAASYFMKLINLAYRYDDTKQTAKSNESLIPSKNKSVVKDIIFKLLEGFNNNLRSRVSATHNKEDAVTKTCSNHQEKLASMVVKYLSLVTDNSVQSLGWIDMCQKLHMFNWTVDMLTELQIKDRGECVDVLLPSVEFLLHLLKKSDEKDQARHKLMSFVTELCRTKSTSALPVVLSVVHAVLNNQEFGSEEEALLIELLVSPLFVATATKPKKVLNACPGFLDLMTNLLSAHSKNKQTAFLKVTLERAFGLLLRKKVDKSLSAMIEYVALHTKEPPSVMKQPLLQGDSVTCDDSLNLIIAVFSYIDQNKDYWEDHSNKRDDIQYLVRGVLKYPSLSHGELDICVKIYATVLKKIAEGSLPIEKDEQILEDILDILQWKMVDVDPSVRETAASAVARLYSAGVLSSHMHVLKSVWGCINDRYEDVIGAVLGLLQYALNQDKLEELYSHIGQDKDFVLNRLKEVYTNRQWDTIKPTVFSLLTTLVTGQEIIKFAEAGLCQDNPKLALSIVEYAGQLVIPALSNEEMDISERVQCLSRWITEGWGDLIYSKANPEDTSCFRKASEILLEVQTFLERIDVSETLVQNLTKIMDGLSGMNKLRGETHVFSGRGLIESMEKVLKWEKGEEVEGNDGDDGSVDEPPSKKMKRSDSGSGDLMTNTSISERLLMQGVRSVYESYKNVRDLNLAKSNNQATAMEDDFEYDLLDSTKELPPVQINSDPFPLERLCQDVCATYSTRFDGQKEAFSSLIPLLPQLFFQDLIKKINPVQLYKEACRSTDEYERNTAMLLYDLEKVLDRDFEMASEHLLEEILKSLISQVIQIVDKSMVGEPASFSQISSTTLFLLMRIHSLLNSKDEVLKFLLRQRRKVHIHHSPDKGREAFVLDDFLQRLSDQKQNSNGEDLIKYFHSDSELMSLLDFSVHKILKSSVADSTAHLKLLTEVEQFEDSDDEGESCLITLSNQEEFQDLLVTYDPKPEKAKIATFIANFKPHEIKLLLNYFSKGIESVEKLNEKLEALLETDRNDSFIDTLKLLGDIVKSLVLLVCHKDTETLTAQFQSLGNLALQLENWFTKDEDDFDTEHNDPTAIDCY